MENTIAKEVGKKVREARKKSDMTQKEVAQKLGMTDSNFAQYERGIILINLEHLIKLPKILNCKITDLLPEKVITDTDRKKAKDPQLQEVIDAWENLNQSLRDAISTIAKEATRETK